MRKFFILYSKRINNLSLVIVLFSFFLLSNFFSIQILNNNKIKKIVQTKGWKEIREVGNRGNILDRNNKELAISIKKYDFWVNTKNMIDKNKIAELFSNTFNKDKDYYLNKLEKTTKYLRLEKNIQFLDAEPILNEYQNINGLNVDVTQQRFYPYNELAAQTLGYLNLNGEGIGGIEGNFNNILQGDTASIKLRKGSKGKYYRTVNSMENIKEGENITLTIDIELQKFIQEELNIIINSTGAKTANGIIIDPFTGDILAMSTVPSFNPNKYYDYDIDTYKNRTISDAYEPGSTFKIVGLAAFIEGETYNLNKKYDCEDGNYFLKNGKLLRDHEPHDSLNIIDIFAHSSNIGMSKIIDSMDDIKLYKYCKLFGFGTKTGVSLSDESKGFLRVNNDWSQTSKTYISIGQELSITNLQLAMSYCAIANGGYLMKPNIIKNISNNKNEEIYTSEPDIIRQVISENNANFILESMKKVISYGTAKNLNLDGYNIGGKTGTAQKYINNSYSKNDFISSFASIFPINQPKYIIIISIDSPKYGYHWANQSAVPASREIIKKIIISNSNSIKTYQTLLTGSENKNLTKKEVKFYSTIEENYITPNLRGKSLKEALEIANSRGLKLQPYGISGRVVWQSIKAGTNFEKDDICKIKVSI